MKYLPFLLAIIFIQIGCSDANSSAQTEQKSDSSKPEQNEIAEKPESKWKYESQVDKLTSSTVYGGLVEAREPLNLKFPYEGSEAAIRLVNRDKKNMAILAVTKGQFLANVIDEQNIKVRFDTAKAESYSCTASSDGDSRYLFIKSTKKFIDKLKSSKTVVIEAEMFENGLQQMEFNCEGLIWDH